MKTKQNLEQLIQVRIVRLAEMIDQMAKQTTQTVGLKNIDLRILNILDGTDGVRINEIARRAHIDKAWVSRSISNLEKKGFIKKAQSTENSKIQVIQLTTQSSRLIEKVRPSVSQHEQQLLNKLNEKEFKASLDQLMLNAENLLIELNSSTK